MKDVFLVKETSILKITEMGSGLIIFGNPSLRIFADEKIFKNMVVKFTGGCSVTTCNYVIIHSAPKIYSFATVKI